MKTFMMTTAIVSLTSFGALAQATDTTGQTTTGQTTTTTTTTTGQQAQQQPMDQQQQRVPAFLVSDFTGKNLYTLDIEEARQLRDQRMGVGPQSGMQQQQAQQPQAGATQQPDQQQVQQLEQQVQQLQQQVQQLQQAGTDQQQVQQLEQEVQQLQQQVQQVQAQPDQQQIQQVEQQVQQVEQQVQQLSGQPVQQQAQQQPQTQPGMQTQATQPMQAQYRDGGMWERNRLRWETGDTFVSQRDRWNDVGSIDDVVMTADGQIRGVLIDVGGFLGIGSRSVMVDVDELFFVSEFQDGGGWFDDTADDFFVVAAMTEDELESLPEWDENNLRSGFEARGYPDRMQEPGGTMGQDGQIAQREGRELDDTTVVVQPEDQQQQQVQQQETATQQQETVIQEQPQQQQQQQMARTQAPEGYQTMEPEQLTADNLMGAEVYDGQNQQIGTVEDLILASDGSAIESIVLDVGGFLGIGQHRVALQIQEADIFWGEQQQDVRIQVPMTEQELEQLPEHQS